MAGILLHDEQCALIQSLNAMSGPRSAAIYPTRTGGYLTLQFWFLSGAGMIIALIDRRQHTVLAQC
jgi:hypothetical protein